MRGLSIVCIVFAGFFVSLSPASANVGSGAVGNAVSKGSNFSQSEVLQIRHGHRHARRHGHHRRFGHRHHRRHWHGLRIRHHHHHRRHHHH